MASLIFPSATVVNVVVLPHVICKFTLQWQPPLSLSCRAEPRPCKTMNLSSHFLPSSPVPPPTLLKSHENLQISPKHTTQLVETFLETQRLKTLLQKLHRNEDPVQVLIAEGDWNRKEFWAVLRFLKETSRMKEALQVFELWTNKEKSRVNEADYAKIIQLLGEAGFMEDAIVKLQQMEKIHRLSPSVAVYNFIIHGYATKGEFGDAKRFLDQMIGQGLVPETETYNGLIMTYGNHKMYDDMVKCMKKMESSGYCSPDHLTYNILIGEFARAGLLERMERTYRTVLSKRLNLQTSTLVAMLGAYTNFGLLEKMEKVYRRILNSKTLPREGLIRKMAGVLIDNYRFSRLEELGHDVASITGKTNLVWSLFLLSQAIILSRKGMESVVEEMKEAKVWPNITFVNMISMAYLKMENFRCLDRFLCEYHNLGIKPDIVTVGIVIDIYMTGYNGVKVLEVWRRMGFLEEAAEMKTDPLVLIAFGKGFFLRTCEELFASFGSKSVKIWTYRDLIDLVFNQNARNLPSLIVHFEGKGRV